MTVTFHVAAHVFLDTFLTEKHFDLHCHVFQRSQVDSKY